MDREGTGGLCLGVSASACSRLGSCLDFCDVWMTGEQGRRPWRGSESFFLAGQGRGSLCHEMSQQRCGDVIERCTALGRGPRCPQGHVGGRGPW